jgi:Protein of unknown function (DUF3300)
VAVAVTVKDAMKLPGSRTGPPSGVVTRTVVLICAGLLAMPYDTGARARPAQTPAAATAAPPAKPIPAEQLDSLVAPIALYPDPLLSQTLVASTYPLEIVQLQQWLAKNTNLKDKALTDAALKQPWDPSIQAMVALPDVVKRLADDIQWTTELGNAFLAQQSDVMDAVQRMRKKAQGTGALVSNEQQKVETKVIENKTVVIVEQANPQVVYVPSYSPVVVYGPPVYPYPPIYYPYYPPGAVVATSMISFGVGVAMGAAWGGGWGWGCGWGGNDIDINVNNNFVRNNNIRNTNVSGNRVGNTNKWQHDSSHRGGAPYSDRATADRFGGTARGDSLASRQSAATRSQSAARSQSTARPQSASGANRPQSAATPSSRTTGAGGGASRSPSTVGSRDVPRSSGSTNRSAFGGSSSSASRASSASSRGSASRGGSRGGRR